MFEGFEVREEQRPVVTEFFRTIDEFRFPQPLVCETTNCHENDLNVWRMRDLVPGGYWSKNGRVSLSGRGLIFVGLFNELNWILGPSRTSETARVLMDHVELIEHQVLDQGNFDFINDVLTFRRPLPARGEANRPRLWYTGQKRQLKDGFGLPLNIGKVKDRQETPVDFHVTVSMTLGEHISRWIAGANARLQDF